MSREELLNVTNPEDAEIMLRTKGFPLDYDALSFVSRLYMDIGDDYRAVALTVDYFEIIKAAGVVPNEPDEYVSFVGYLYATMFKNQDVERSLWTAALLADIFKGRKNPELLVLSYELVKLCGRPFENSTLYLIVKEAIITAIDIIEDTDELPSNETIWLICRMIMYLPLCPEDRPFVLEMSNRIAQLYDGGSVVQLYIIRAFLPEMERLLATMLKALLELDKEAEDPTVINLLNCQKILFSEGRPQPLEGDFEFTIQIGKPRELSEYFEMVNRVQKLSDDIVQAKLFGEWGNYAEFKLQFKELINYFTSFTPNASPLGDPEHSLMLIGLIFTGLDIDFTFASEQLYSYESRISELECENIHSANTLNTMQAIFFKLGDVYTKLDNLQKTYESHVKWLKHGNLYFRRICLEYDFECFIDRVKDEYFFYHDVMVRATKLLDKHTFPLGDMYVELCKRKNLLYIGELWRKGHGGLAEASHNLKNDFTLSDIVAAIPPDTVLIDFFYFRQWYMDEEYEDDSPKDKLNADCIAFVVDSDGIVSRHIVGTATNLSNLLATTLNGEPAEGSYKQYLYCPNESIDIHDLEDNPVASPSNNAHSFFKNMTERLLCNRKDKTCIIVCVDGDLNSVAFASLAYQNGFITDYYAVRNIGSIYDIVHPRKREAIENALLFTVSDFGQPKAETPKKWGALKGSELEGYLLESTFKEGFLEVCHLTSDDATVDALKDTLKNISSGIVHFSTHGCVRGGNIGIVAATANLTDDAILWDTDLSQYSFENTALVVYALCFGAKQTARLNDSLSGFIKFSLLSGANAIIAPVHPITDLSSAVLLNEFYKIYLSNETPEIALQKAIRRVRTITKTELLAEYHIEAEGEYPYAAPMHWASWVCFSAQGKTEE